MGILNDISMSELTQMREEGLTNKEIAARIGSSYATVVKLLGPQPAGLRKKPEPRQPTYQAKVVKLEKPAPRLAETEETAIVETPLLVDEKITKLCGMFGNYTVHAKKKQVVVEFRGMEHELSFEDVTVFSKELFSLARNLENFKVGMEGVV